MGRRLAFEHWVAFNSKTISKALSDKGDFVCPLLPCLEHFENLESCLGHLLRCPHLLGASYWCPFCWVPENFAAPQPSGDDDFSCFWNQQILDVPRPSRDNSLRSPALKKSSIPKVKRAIAALTKRFGRNSSEASRSDTDLSQNNSEAARNDSVPDPYHEQQPEVPELSARRTICELEVPPRQRFELSTKRQTRGPSPVESSFSLDKSVVSPI